MVESLLISSVTDADKLASYDLGEFTADIYECMDSIVDNPNHTFRDADNVYSDIIAYTNEEGYSATMWTDDIYLVLFKPTDIGLLSIIAYDNRFNDNSKEELTPFVGYHFVFKPGLYGALASKYPENRLDICNLLRNNDTVEYLDEYSGFKIQSYEYTC